MQAAHPGAETQADPGGAVQVKQVLGNRETNGPPRGYVRGVDQGGVVTTSDRGRCHLGADQATTDHDHAPGARVEGGPEATGVIDRAEHEGAPHTRNRLDVPRTSPGRDDETVERDPGPVVHDDVPPGEVQPGGGLAEAPSRLSRRAADVEALPVSAARQECLRQGISVVGPVRFGPDHGQPAVVSQVAQRFGRTVSGKRGADDHDVLHADSTAPGSCAPRSGAGHPLRAAYRIMRGPG